MITYLHLKSEQKKRGARKDCPKKVSKEGAKGQKIF